MTNSLSRARFRAGASLLLALAAMTSGCASSSTWRAWDSTAARIDDIERRTDAEQREFREASEAALAFDSCEDVARAVVAAYPGLAAPRARARAALAMARAEGALPAPSARLTVWDFPISDPSMADRAGMYMLGVAQELPPAAGLDGSARASVETARAALGELTELRRDVASAAAHDCAEWAGAAWLRTRLARWLTSIETMRAAVDARYAAAGASLADVARMARELATAERLIARAASDEDRAVESLRARLGLSQTTSLGAAPPLDNSTVTRDAPSALAYALRNRGELRVARANIAAAHADAAAAEARASVPTFMFGTMYMQRPQARPGLGLEVGMTLPWLWSGEPARAEAARAEATAAEAEVAAIERSVDVEVRTALATLETTRRVLDVLRAREAPAAALAQDATAVTYGAGEGTLLDWLDAVRAVRELDIAEAELLTELAHARADVDNAMGLIVGASDPPPPRAQVDGR